MELVHIRMGNLTSFTRKIFDNLRWKSGLSDAKTTCKNYIEIFNSVHNTSKYAKANLYQSVNRTYRYCLK